MAIDKLASVAGSHAAQALEGGKAKFGNTLAQVKGAPKQAPTQTPQKLQPNAAPKQTANSAQAVSTNKVAMARKVDGAQKPQLEQAGKALDQVSAAQARLDKVLALAQSGRTFTPAELLALQAQVCSASQEIDLAGKVVEKATGGVKQVLQTQV